MSVEQWWSEDSRGKPKKLGKKKPCSNATSSATKSSRINLRLRVEKATPKFLSYDATLTLEYVTLIMRTM
jgi:hypothetical protein